MGPKATRERDGGQARLVRLATVAAGTIKSGWRATNPATVLGILYESVPSVACRHPTGQILRPLKSLFVVQVSRECWLLCSWLDSPLRSSTSA
jgi:hypothetical protein